MSKCRDTTNCSSAKARSSGDHEKNINYPWDSYDFPHDAEQLRILKELSNSKVTKTAKRKTILFIEDDRFFALDYLFALKAYGYCVVFASTSDDALRLAKHFRFIRTVIIDIRMHYGRFFDSSESGAGIHTGTLLALELLNHLDNPKFIALTHSNDAMDEAFFRCLPGSFFCNKQNETPTSFARKINMELSHYQKLKDVQSFIVHGHDKLAVLDLKNYLQNTLKLKEPIILSEKPNMGLTLIEKFEFYASESDIAFVLLTPDDLMNIPTSLPRARQNVIFEYGYFLGSLGRKSGRTFLLHKDDTEVPSDLKGIVSINITNGIEAAGEEIRKELYALFRMTK